MSKVPKFNTLLFNEVNEVKKHKLDAYKSHIESPDTVEAWGLNSRQQCIDEITGKYLQFIDPKSYKPIKIYEGEDGDEDVVSDVQVISSQTEDEEMTLLDNKKLKDGRLLWIGIALAGVVLILLIAVLKVFQHGDPQQAAIIITAVV